MIRAITLSLLLSSTVNAAFISIEPVAPPADPENYIYVDAKFFDTTHVRQYIVRGLTSWPQGNGAEGFKDLTFFDSDPAPETAVWDLNNIWLPHEQVGLTLKIESAFPYSIDIDFTEFITAGDTSIVMTLDNRYSIGEPWNVIRFDSPNLGMVERTYTVIPEPATLAGLALAVISASVLGRRTARQRSVWRAGRVPTPATAIAPQRRRWTA